MDNNSPLFLAHQNGRNADKFLKKKAFDQAIECHLNAIFFLQEAMNLTSFSKSLESLQLQKNYHLTQTEIIRTKKLQFSLKKKLVELKKKKKMEKKKFPEEDKNHELQWALLRAMDEAENLISLLRSRQDEGCGAVGLVPVPGAEPPIESSSNHPKDDKSLIDELSTVNAQLRVLISKILEEMDASRKEMEGLRSRLKLYEGQTLPDLAPLELPTFDFTHM